MEVLIDTSFLLAAIYTKDENHIVARETRRNLKHEQVLPVPVLHETFQMIAARMSYIQAIQVFRNLQSSTFRIERLSPSDMWRMAEIMDQYHDAEFDFADAALMALSERLSITQVYTFDRRDFGMFRPRHTDYLQLLP